MRGYIPEFNLASPGSLEELLDCLNGEPNRWSIFAGGTDIMVLMEAGELRQKNFLNIMHLKELRGIHTEGDTVLIGATTTYADIQNNALMRKHFPSLCTAASLTGSIAIQNRGTIGGNIINASPAGDSLPALLAYDAEIELVSKNGARWVPYHAFHLGYKASVRDPSEILSRARLRLPGQNLKHFYRKVGTRKAQAISKVVMAATAMMEDKKLQDVRIALGSVGPIPLRCQRTEEFLRGKSLGADLISQAADILKSEITPIDDIRSTEAFRRDVAANVLRQFLNEATT